MKIWEAYRNLVSSTLVVSNDKHVKEGVSYWRDRLFYYMALYCTPFSLVALVPGVTMSIISDVPFLAITDILAVVSMCYLAIGPGLTLPQRKLLFIATFYVLTLILLYYLGSFGPGLLYLFAITIFVTLIYSVKMGYYTVLTNAFVCLGFGLLIHFRIVNSPLVDEYDMGSWIAVSSNEIFLSMVSVLSLHLLLRGLQSTIENESRLQDELLMERKALEDALVEVRKKNQELEQFAYFASHDLQEPLTTIISLTDLQKEGDNKGLLSDKEYFDYIGRASNRMRQLIHGLLEYSRIGRSTPEKQFSDLNKLLKEVLADMRVRIEESDAEINSVSLPQMFVFPLEIRQLFQNLISNALKFSRNDESPRIDISVEEKDEEWLFKVSDNGIGISQSGFEKIFVIFQRLNSRSAFEGTGIGLAYCKKIVELHGGKIWVESELGSGSTFFFTLSKKE